MALSLELLNVLVLAVASAILLKDRLDHVTNVENAAAAGFPERYHEERSLSETETLASNFGSFVGVWYDCQHTILKAFEGETEEKSIVETAGCDYTNIGNITKIKNYNDQALQFDLFLLNRCSFHGFGGRGQRPCPNDAFGNEVSPGKILVKYSFKGVGSFAETDRIHFFADQSYTRNKFGEWRSNFERAKIENVDSMICKQHAEGIVCDWHLNEYRTAAIQETTGCKQKDGECKPGLGKSRCKNGGGTWSEECPRTKYVSDGFLYDTFGSYYLVKDIAKCKADCPEHAESQKKPDTKAEDETGVR